MGWRGLYRAGIRIGRDHIASVVNTLVLAYAGAALPLLLLFSIAQSGVSTVANSELVAEEIVRTVRHKVPSAGSESKPHAADQVKQQHAAASSTTRPGFDPTPSAWHTGFVGSHVQGVDQLVGEDHLGAALDRGGLRQPYEGVI